MSVTTTTSKVYQAPGHADSPVEVKPRYENFIGGKWLPPAPGPVHGATCSPPPPGRSARCRSPPPRTSSSRWTPPTPPRTPGARRRRPSAPQVLNADRRRHRGPHQEMLAVAESWENGKPVRETLAADIPLAADHFRYFAAAARAEEGTLDRDRQAHHGLPLPRAARRGRPDHPVQLPAADGGVEARPGAGGGQLLGAQAGLADPLVDPEARRGHRGRRPAGRDQRRHRARREIGKALATSPRIAKIAFTGETVTGRLIMQYAAQNLIPSTPSSAASRPTSSSPT